MNGGLAACRLFIHGSMPTALKDRVKAALKQGGGKIVYYFNTTEVTHVATVHGEINFDEYQQALAHGIPVVTPEWVYQSVKRIQPPEYFSPDPAKIFSGLIVSSSQITGRERNVLAAGILHYGGRFQVKLTTECTHLIAYAISNPKCEYAKEKGIHIVSPGWFNDSIKDGRLYPERHYPVEATTYNNNNNHSDYDFAPVTLSEHPLFTPVASQVVSHMLNGKAKESPEDDEVETVDSDDVLATPEILVVNTPKKPSQTTKATPKPLASHAKRKKAEQEQQDEEEQKDKAPESGNDSDRDFGCSDSDEGSELQTTVVQQPPQQQHEKTNGDPISGRSANSQARNDVSRVAKKGAQPQTPTPIRPTPTPTPSQRHTPKRGRGRPHKAMYEDCDISNDEDQDAEATATLDTRMSATSDTTLNTTNTSNKRPEPEVEPKPKRTPKKRKTMVQPSDSEPADAETHATAKVVQQTQTPKRGRGRPPKNPATKSTHTASENEEAPKQASDSNKKRKHAVAEPEPKPKSKSATESTGRKKRTRKISSASDSDGHDETGKEKKTKTKPITQTQTKPLTSTLQKTTGEIATSAQEILGQTANLGKKRRRVSKSANKGRNADQKEKEQQNEEEEEVEEKEAEENSPIKKRHRIGAPADQNGPNTHILADITNDTHINSKKSSANSTSTLKRERAAPLEDTREQIAKAAQSAKRLSAVTTGAEQKQSSDVEEVDDEAAGTFNRRTKKSKTPAQTAPMVTDIEQDIEEDIEDTHTFGSTLGATATGPILVDAIEDIDNTTSVPDSTFVQKLRKTRSSAHRPSPATGTQKAVTAETVPASTPASASALRKETSTPNVYAPLFSDFVFYFCKEVPASVAEQATQLIELDGGTVSPVWDKSTCTCLICITKETPEFQEALEAGIPALTSQWLRDAYCTRKLPAYPNAAVIHTPLQSARPIPGMERLVISQTGALGYERNDIEQMIEASGAKYTSSLTMTNTHIICTVPSGLKYNKALEWGVKVATPEWIENCIKTWTLCDCSAYSLDGISKKDQEGEAANVDPGTQLAPHPTSDDSGWMTKHTTPSTTPQKKAPKETRQPQPFIVAAVSKQPQPQPKSQPKLKSQEQQPQTPQTQPKLQRQSQTQPQPQIQPQLQTQPQLQSQEQSQPQQQQQLQSKVEAQRPKDDNVAADPASSTGPKKIRKLRIVTLRPTPDKEITRQQAYVLWNDGTYSWEWKDELKRKYPTAAGFIKHYKTNKGAKLPTVSAQSIAGLGIELEAFLDKRQTHDGQVEYLISTKLGQQTQDFWVPKPMIASDSTASAQLGAFEASCADPATPAKLIFLLSGVAAINRPQFEAIIKKLGGDIIPDFSERATHLIVGSIVRTEKVLSSCAAGIWVLETKYLEACDAAGRFIPEEPFEVGANSDAMHFVGNNPKARVYMAAFRKRRLLRQEKNQRAFDGYVLYIVGDSDAATGLHVKMVTAMVEAGGAVTRKVSPPFRALSEEEKLKTFAIFMTAKAASNTRLKREFEKAGITCVTKFFVIDIVCGSDKAIIHPSEYTDLSLL
eukprot:TRINITY_DN1654_c1_g1_i2.p1 TRINITY_DN1654_c1_g1~~TRINITY_DN1654_c1_g1_i2.p1  ORF type:complete len:1547 (+),score=321.69 TRINITY_DN1654_c1_g1_i2:87-4727(+)